MENFGERKLKKRRISAKYNYTFGDMHPGMHIGHKNCVVCQKGLPVPAGMGWLWNVHHNIPGLKRRRGWQPGAVGKTIAKMMTFKLNKELERQMKSKNKNRKNVGVGGQQDQGDGDSEQEDPVEPKPTLKVQRKGDIYTIQVNPLKDFSELVKPNEDPYIDCDPLVFKLIKKRSPEETARAEARKIARVKRKRDAEIRKALAEAAEDICKCAYMDVFCNDLKAIDTLIESCPTFKEPTCICQDDSSSSLSSNATWDIEYTPPFGLFDASSQRNRSSINAETQYISEDTGILKSQKNNQEEKRVQLIMKTKKLQK